MTTELPPGHPGPDDAERVTEGTCDYECDRAADFRVQLGDETFLTCGRCSRQNAIHAEDIVEWNETLEANE